MKPALKKESSEDVRQNKKKAIWIAALILTVVTAAVSYYYWPTDNTLPELHVKPMPDIKTEVRPALIYKPKPDLPPRDSAGHPRSH